LDRVKTTAVFFDAGFTLVDLVTNPLDVYLGKAREIGVELDPAKFSLAFKRCWSRLEEDFRKACPDLTSSEENERAAWRAFTNGLASEFPALFNCHSDWHARLVRHFDDPQSWKPAPHAVETLERLSQSGRRLAVVSNWHSALLPILDMHGLTPYLEFALTSAEARRKKPHREIFELALARLNVAADEAAFVGDSWNDDVIGSLAAGMLPIHVHRTSETPRNDERVRVVRCLSELEGLLGVNRVENQ
jgi:REG-2-like HAD superfamily hydrolase